MSPRALHGVRCAPGRAAGRAWVLRPKERRSGTLNERWDAVRAELIDSRNAAAGAPADELAHFAVVLALLDDPELTGPARRLEEAGLSASEAIQGAFQPAIGRLLSHGDPELSARASELRSLWDRLLLRFPGPPTLSRPVVLLAHDLTADQLLHWLGPSGRMGLKALVLERGGPLTHTSILARQRGLPVVGGIGGLLEQVQSGEGLLVDADRGLVIASPGPDEVQAFRVPRPRVSTRPDSGLRLFANVSSAEESALARQRGAEGLALVRTDALLATGREPGEDEQLSIYRQILAPWEGRRAWIRTFDAPELGTDSALGPRGVRWLSLLPDRSRRQLRALCHAAASLPRVQTGVLLPMVSRPSELRAARLLLRELNPPRSPLPELGCMVETPAAALRIDELLDEADFVAVGTNDLLQFLVGASREDHRLVDLLDPEDPALWELLARVATAARARGRPALVCGALAEEGQAHARLRELGYMGLGVGLAALIGGPNSSRPGG